MSLQSKILKNCACVAPSFFANKNCQLGQPIYTMGINTAKAKIKIAFMTSKQAGI